jgi:hypothetical protein
VQLTLEQAGEPLFGAPGPQEYRPVVKLAKGRERAWQQVNFLLALDIQKEAGTSGHKAALLDELAILAPAHGDVGEAPILIAIQVKGEEGSVSEARLAAWDEAVNESLSLIKSHFTDIVKVWVAKATLQTSAVRYATQRENFLVIGRETLGVCVPCVADSLIATYW